MNLMVYVTHVFMKLFGWERQKAEKHMMEVHEKGKSALVLERVLKKAGFSVRQPGKSQPSGNDGTGGMKLVRQNKGGG